MVSPFRVRSAQAQVCGLWHGEARCTQGRHQRGCIIALAARRARFACPSTAASEVQATLGRGNIATTSGYLHARPKTSSGLHLDQGVFLR
jgi:hypothetical protein